MKAIPAIIFWAAISLNGNYYTKNVNSITPEETAKIIDRIRTLYQVINANQPKYHRLEKDVMDDDKTTEGGSAVAYKDWKNMRKLILDYYGETGKAVIEYYFDRKEVFFAFEKYVNYDKPIYEPGWKIKSVKESRYYFYNGQMIRWMQGNVLQNANTDTYKKEATDLLGQSKRYCDYMSNEQ